MKKNREQSRWSIRNLWKGFYLVTMIVVIGVLIATFWLSNRALQLEAAQNSRTMLEGYISQLDQQLVFAESQLFQLAVIMSDNQDLLQVTDPNEQYFLQCQAKENMREVLTVNPAVNGIWYYRPEGQGIPYLETSANLTDYAEAVGIKKSVESLNLENIPSEWFFREIRGKEYLYRMMKRNDAYLGMWIQADVILDTLENFNTEEGNALFLCDQSGRLVEGNDTSIMEGIKVISRDEGNQVQEVNGERYIQVSAQSEPGKFWVASVIPMKTVLKNVSVIKPMMYGLVVLLIMLFVGSVLFTEQLFYKPFRILLGHIGRMRTGDLTTHIQETGNSREFLEIFQNINQMQDDIRKLKIDNYERQIQEEKTKRQFLQMQIKSHFFMNCLNIIYSLAELKNYSLIQKMDMCMVNYLRYLARKEDEPVVIEQELEHIRNYMEIQELRYPGRFSYEIQVEEEMKPAPIYPLVIQTFVENSMKYSMDPGKENEIHIQMGRKENWIQIIITDNGAGFSEEILPALNNSGQMKLYGLTGVGITNIKNRLKLYYRGKATIRFSNQEPSGARVVIEYPMSEEDKQLSV